MSAYYSSVARCPACNQQVEPAWSSCPNCSERLIRRKFKVMGVLVFGALAVLIALVVSVLVVPLTVVGMLFAMFARERLHVVSIERGDEPPPPAERVIDIEAS